MSTRGLCLLSALTFFCVPVSTHAADNDVEAWTATEKDLRAPAAGISLPTTVVGLSLAKSGEASHGGEGIDNVAQYLSQDGTVQATLYVYLPTYADAAIGAYMTDKAIVERFGPKTRRTAYASVPVAGRPGTAIRAVYDDAGDGTLTTAAAFVQVGRWMVKLRVTGPTERRKAVLSGLDGMLAALRVADPASLRAAAPARLGACPAQAGSDARLISNAPSASASAAPALTAPSGGYCISGTVSTADGRYDILRDAASADGKVIIPTDDSGTTLSFVQTGAGYQMALHAIGQVDLYGIYDRVPSATQISAIIEGKDPQTAHAKSIAAYAANGEMTLRRTGAQGR